LQGRQTETLDRATCGRRCSVYPATLLDFGHVRVSKNHHDTVVKSS
jgi:hypothetical protein